MIICWALCALLSLNNFAIVHTFEKHVLHRNSTSCSGSSRYMTQPCTLFLRQILLEGNNHACQWDCELSPTDASIGNVRGDIVALKGVEFQCNEKEVGGRELESGITTIFSPNGCASPTDVTIPANGYYLLGRRENKYTSWNNFNRNFVDKEIITTSDDTILPVGERTVLAVRITANDNENTFSAAYLSKQTFGLNNIDSFNVGSVYADCSYNKLNLKPATGAGIVDGVYELSININSTGADQEVVHLEAVGQLSQVFGDLPSRFNHVLFCYPPGTHLRGHGWFAYGWSNSWYAAFNDYACTYPSVQIHEIGHNFNLRHSHELPNTYADQTGWMGASYRKNEGPVICFNSAKSWQLGWYSDQTEALYPVPNKLWSGELVGVSDYGLASHDEKIVVVKIVGSNDGFDYYVGFNRNIGINYGVFEARNKITVTRVAESTYASSDLVGKLEEGEEYAIENFSRDVSPSVIIHFKRIRKSSALWYAEIDVFTTLEPSSAPATDAPVTPPPTLEPSYAPATDAPVTPPPTLEPSYAPATDAPVTSPPTLEPSYAPAPVGTSEPITVPLVTQAPVSLVTTSSSPTGELTTTAAPSSTPAPSLPPLATLSPFTTSTSTTKEPSSILTTTIQPSTDSNDVVSSITSSESSSPSHSRCLLSSLTLVVVLLCYSSVLLSL